MKVQGILKSLAVASLLGLLISCSHRSGGGVTPALPKPHSRINKAASGLPTSEWPKFHRDIKNSGLTSDTGPSTGNVRWTYATADLVRSSPAVASVSGVRTVYFGSEDDYVYALNSDGTMKWRYCPNSGSTSGHGYDFDSTPALSVDTNGITTAYIGCNDGKLYALQVDPDHEGKGKAIWTYATTSGAQVRSSPTVGSDGSIYFGSSDHKVYALNSDGTAKWTSAASTGDSVYSSPAIGSNGAVYIGSNDGKLYSLDPDYGSVNWTYFRRNELFRSSPAVAAGSPDTIYIGSAFGSSSKLCAVNSSNGVERWTYTLPASVYSSPAIGSDGTIYVGCDDYKVYALTDHGTYASVKWSYTTGDAVRSCPAIGSDGTVYVGSDDGYVYALNGSSGSLVWSHQVGNKVESSPAISGDGVVSVGCDDKQLYAFAPNVSGNYTVSGGVYESDYQTPISGVLLTLSPGGRNALTGSNGLFTILNVVPGAYSITAKKDGYVFYPDAWGFNVVDQNVTNKWFVE